MAEDDDFEHKALECFALFALNQGEVCTCPSRALVQQSFYNELLEAAIERTRQIKQGDPLDTETMIAAQASRDQLEKFLAYIDIGRENHRMMLDHYQQTKNLLVSYSPQPMGLF